MVDSPRLFRVFVSSSFVDMAGERQALLDNAFAPLTELCASRRASFQAIDLRWGIGPDAALGQQTMPICLAEVRRCLRLSPRLNFLALLGDRRGWLPVPTSIPWDEYRLLASGMTPAERRLVRKWYRHDRNAVPPALRLLPRAGPYVDRNEWEAVECRLHDILQRVVHRVPEWRRRAYVGSAVEQEVAAGVFDVPDPIGAFAIVRHRRGANESDEEQHVRRLESELRGKLPRDRVLTYTTSVGERSAEADLERMAAAVYTRFAAVIESELEGERPGDGPGEVTTTHRRLAEQLLAVPSASAEAAMSPRARLVGRDDVAAQMTRFARLPGPGLLAVVGQAGTGKSALLGAVASDLAVADPGRAGGPLVIVRMLGTTADTARLDGLLRGIVGEVGAGLGVDVEPALEVPELVGQLAELLARADRAVVMVLDAIDQLAPDHGAHHLGWLPAPLPPHVRVVLSTLPGVTEEALRHRTDSTVLPLRGLAAADGRSLLRRWLAAAGRTLTEAQERLVLDGFARHGRPLWLRLAFEQAQSWSSDAEPGELPPDLSDLLRLLFARLARDEARGPTLVGHLLGLVAASGFGLSEPEVIEALSADAEVMDEVRVRAHHRWRADLTAFPVVLWAQLRADLQPYLTERDVDGDLLIDFYHRVLRDVAAADELRPPAGRARHGQLAALFTRAADPDGTGSWRGPAPRAFTRLPRHLEAAEAWPSLTRTLLDLRFLERKATVVGRVTSVDGRGRRTIRHGGVHEVRTDLADLISIPSDALSTADREVCAALVDALGLEADLLTSRPELLWQQLANRLRWGAPPALAALLDREEARRTSADDPPWLQLQRPVASTPGLLHILRTRGRAHSCALSPDGSLLAGGGDDGAALWDAADGAWLADLPGHHGPVHACAFSADGRALYTADEGGTVRRWTWDGVRARLETSRRICQGQLRACAASVDHVVVAAADGMYLCGGEGLQVLARLDESDTVRCCAVDERGDLMVAGYVDGGVRTWRRDGWRVVPAGRRAGAHEGAVYDCTVDGAGTTVVTAGQDGALRRWDSELVPVGDPLVDRALPMSTGVWGCAGSRTLDRAVTALVGGAVQVWNVPGATATLLAGHAGTVNAVAMSQDGSIVASAGYDGTVRLWDPAAAATASAEPFSAMIQALAMSSDGRRIVTVDAYGIARLGSTRAPAGETVFATCQTWCMDGAATADLRTLAVVDQAGRLEVWDVDDEPRRRHQLPHDNAAACVLIGHRLAISAGDDGTCHGWDIIRGDRLWTIDLGRGVPVLTVADGRLVVLAASGSGVVRLLDPRTGRGRTLRDSGDPVISSAIGPDGAIAVGTDQGEVVRWQADEALTPCRQFGGHDGRVLHIAPGTRRFPFLSASSNGELALWAADATEAPRRWPGHDGPIRRVAVSASDELAISAGDDKTLRIWTLTGDQQALLPIAGNGQVLALHSTSQLIACADDGGFVYLGRLRHS